AEHAGVRHVGTGESEADDRQKDERQAETELRFEDLAKRLEHGKSVLDLWPLRRGEARPIRSGALSIMRRCRNSAPPQSARNHCQWRVLALTASAQGARQGPVSISKFGNTNGQAPLHCRQLEDAGHPC